MDTSFFTRHEKILLLFSGGKDSAACLWLVKDFWPRIQVVWVNAGNPYPETVEYMQEIRELVPFFHEIKSNQPGFVKEHGYPLDWAPGLTVPKLPVKVTTAHSCCGTNLWLPTLKFAKELGATGIIRGQKASDVLKSSTKSGDWVEGIEYLHPVENWTDAEVVTYLGKRLPLTYKRGRKASLDCLDCTAYVSQDPGRLEELKTLSPKDYDKVFQIHAVVREELTSYMEKLHG